MVKFTPLHDRILVRRIEEGEATRGGIIIPDSAAILLLRFMSVRAQDRIIRLEERTRLERLVPGDLRGRVADLAPSQLVALRFAPDDEVPELTRRALNGELKTQGDIKRAIRNWRADHLRV